MTTASVTPPSPFAIFRNRSFTLLWVGQLVSTIGGALTSLAAGILIYNLTQSALSVGLMLMATAIPTVLVGLLAGVFVDRYDRRRIMIACEIVRAVLVALIPILIGYNLAWLYIIVALSSAVGQFFDPAHESLLPEVASDEELGAANALIAIAAFGSTAVGFAASGLIASRFPIEWAFYLDAITFMFSALMILLVRAPTMKAEDKTTVSVVLQNLRSGARFLWDNQRLRSLLLVLAPVFVGFGMWNTLLLPFALTALHTTEFEYGLQEALTSIGFVAGSLLMTRLTDRLREGQWLILSYLGMGLIGAIYAFSTSVPLAIVLVTISGFLNAPGSIARRLVTQRHTPREMRGRVNSAFFVARDVIFLIGMGLAGLADVIDIRVMIFISALLLLVAGGLALVMPGMGVPAAEWRRAISLLRAAPAAPGLGAGRLATLTDLDNLVGRLPVLQELSAQNRATLLAQAQVAEAAPGTAIVRQGDKGEAAFFILEGKVVAGLPTEDGGIRSLAELNPGDFFGEVAALTGSPRTANVVAAEPTTLILVPATALRELMRHPGFSDLVLATMADRLTRTRASDLPRLASVDQQAAKELRAAPAEA